VDYVVVILNEGEINHRQDVRHKRSLNITSFADQPEQRDIMSPQRPQFNGAVLGEHCCVETVVGPGKVQLGHLHHTTASLDHIHPCMVSKARFPFKRNRLCCVRCINENRKKRKRLRWQAANQSWLPLTDRPYWPALA